MAGLFAGRPIASRSFGDGTADSKFGVPIVTGAWAVTGSGLFSAQFPVTGAWAVTGSATFEATAQDAVAWTHISFKGQAFFTVTVPPRGKNREYIAVDMNGNPIGSFGTDAVPGAVTWELNVPDSYRFGLVACSSKAHLVHDEKVREVQCWRGDQLLTWGPMTRPTQDGPDGLITVDGRDPRWYFMRRHIGKADRTNHILNGDFEDGLTHWNTAYHVLEPQANLTGANISATIATDRVLTGIRSLRLAQANPANPELNFMVQQFFVWTVDQSENPKGDEWSLSAHCFIPSVSWVAPGAENLGINVLRASTTETVTITRPGGSPEVYPKVIEMAQVGITESTPRDTWITLVADLLEPVTGDPEFVLVELWCPDGVIYWDRVTLARKESLSFFGVDQATIVSGIGSHLQDTNFDKTDLNIDFDCPPTGRTRDRVYVHSEHPNGWDSMSEFTYLDDGLDIGMRFTPTTRTLYTAFPMQGTYKPHLTLALGRNISSYQHVFDGEAAASSVIILGEGFGSTREEGFAVDSSIFANDVVLERVSIAPPETEIDSLDNRAAEVLAVTLNPVIINVTTYPDTDLFGRLTVGDTVNVDIRDGALEVNAVYRVIRITLNPDDSLSIFLNIRS